MFCVGALRRADWVFVVALVALATTAFLALSCRADDGIDNSAPIRRNGWGGGWVTGAPGGSSNIGSSSGGGGAPFEFSDAAPFPADAPLADAGLFNCGGCLCDGKTHYCLFSSGPGGKTPPTPDAGMALCPEQDAGSPATADGCLPLPATCGTSPSCACIDVPFPVPCPCSDAGGGLLVSCVIP